MTYPALKQPSHATKKHDRSLNSQPVVLRPLRPTGERPAWLGRMAVSRPVKSQLDWLAGLPNTVVFDGLDRPWWHMLQTAGRQMLSIWRRRAQSRRDLARIDARTLMDAGISPGAAGFEAALPFWRPSIQLREYNSRD